MSGPRVKPIKFTPPSAARKTELEAWAIVKGFRGASELALFAVENYISRVGLTAVQEAKYTKLVEELMQGPSELAPGASEGESVRRTDGLERKEPAGTVTGWDLTNIFQLHKTAAGAPLPAQAQDISSDLVKRIPPPAQDEKFMAWAMRLEGAGWQINWDKPGREGNPPSAAPEIVGLPQFVGLLNTLVPPNERAGWMRKAKGGKDLALLRDLMAEIRKTYPAPKAQTLGKQECSRASIVTWIALGVPEEDREELEGNLRGLPDDPELLERFMAELIAKYGDA